MDEGDASPGCSPSPGRFHHPQDAADLLQVQPPTSGGTLPLRPPLTHPLLRNGRRERSHTWDHRRRPDLRRPDQLTPASPFPGDQGRSGQGRRLPQDLPDRRLPAGGALRRRTPLRPCPQATPQPRMGRTSSLLAAYGVLSP